jgi:hypothetical protein
LQPPTRIDGHDGLVFSLLLQTTFQNWSAGASFELGHGFVYPCSVLQWWVYAWSGESASRDFGKGALGYFGVSYVD